MDKFGIKNLRSLVVDSNVEISPITVLIGKNSSGKSTFIRAFPLLQQTISTKSSESILWYGENVDMGSFESVINQYSDDKEITFSFEYTNDASRMSTIDFSEYSFYSSEFNDDLKSRNTKKWIINVTCDKYQITTLNIEIADQKIYIKMSPKRIIDCIKINNMDLDIQGLGWYKENGKFLPIIIHSKGDKLYVGINDVFKVAIINALMDISDNRTFRT